MELQKLMQKARKFSKENESIPHWQEVCTIKTSNIVQEVSPSQEMWTETISDNVYIVQVTKSAKS